VTERRWNATVKTWYVKNQLKSH